MSDESARALAFRDDGRVRLPSRNRLSLDDTWPETVEALTQEDASRIVLDGSDTRMLPLTPRKQLLRNAFELSRGVVRVTY